jgi:hypothetical protein
MRVAVKGEDIDLTPTEFHLVATLIAQPRRVFTRGQLLDAVHGVSSFSRCTASATSLPMERPGAGYGGRGWPNGRRIRQLVLSMFVLFFVVFVGWTGAAVAVVFWQAFLITGRLVSRFASDDGAGIPAEQLEAVFDRFHKGAESSGSGLGLTISSDLVRAHGGTIAISSIVGAGTTITVSLPLR